MKASCAARCRHGRAGARSRRNAAIATVVSSGALRWAVAVGLEHGQGAAGDRLVHVAADLDRCDHVVGALQDQGRHRHRCQVVTGVGEEGDVGELPGHVGVGAAEARGELLAELGPLRVGHDHRRHRAGPAEVVAVEGAEELGDVGLGEAADVALVVDVTRRGPHHHQCREHVGAGLLGEHADHRGDRVAHEDHVVKVQRVDDLDDVVGVARQRGVARGVVRRQVGPARADVVEQDHPVAVREARRDVAPHVLVAAEPVREGPDVAQSRTGLLRKRSIRGKAASGTVRTRTVRIRQPGEVLVQKPWSCDDSMGGNTIVREVEPGRGDRSDQQRADRLGGAAGRVG